MISLTRRVTGELVQLDDRVLVETQHVLDVHQGATELNLHVKVDVAQKRKSCRIVALGGAVATEIGQRHGAVARGLLPDRVHCLLGLLHGLLGSLFRGSGALRGVHSLALFVFGCFLRHPWLRLVRRRRASPPRHAPGHPWLTVNAHL
jgi:hypothetical protein